MDFEADFWETVRSTVQQMKARNKATQTWNADDGSTVEGWPALHSASYSPKIEGNPASNGWWRETWGNSQWILSVDGTLWVYNFSGEDSSNLDRTLLTKSLSPLTGSYLVGNQGKPFAKYKAELERLPYR